MRGFTGVLALVLALSGVPVQAQEGSVESVHLDRHPRLSGTTCHPTHVLFSGRIKTDGPTFVTYRWLRSDGTHQDRVLQFTKANGRSISTDWDQTATGSGWVRLVVLSPRHVETPKTYFWVHCGTG